MSANTSQRKARSSIFASPVETYSAWLLTADCGAYGPRAVPLANLPLGLTICQVVMRLRCRACGGRAAAASIDNQLQGWRRRMVRIWGPGSEVVPFGWTVCRPS